MTTVASVAAVATVHEEVHQRADGEQQPGKIRIHMGAMLEHEKETGDHRKRDESNLDAARPARIFV